MYHVVSGQAFLAQQLLEDTGRTFTFMTFGGHTYSGQGTKVL